MLLLFVVICVICCYAGCVCVVCQFVFVCVFMGNFVLFICTCRWCYILQGLVCILFCHWLSLRLLSFVHVSICCRYGCMYGLVAFSLVSVEIMVMPYTCEVSFNGGCGMLCVYVLKCG